MKKLPAVWRPGVLPFVRLDQCLGGLWGVKADLDLGSLKSFSAPTKFENLKN